MKQGRIHLLERYPDNALSQELLDKRYYSLSAYFSEAKAHLRHKKGGGQSFVWSCIPAAGRETTGESEEGLACWQKDTMREV